MDDLYPLLSTMFAVEVQKMHKEMILKCLITRLIKIQKSNQVTIIFIKPIYVKLFINQTIISILNQS